MTVRPKFETHPTNNTNLGNWRDAVYNRSATDDRLITFALSPLFAFYLDSSSPLVVARLRVMTRWRSPTGFGSAVHTCTSIGPQEGWPENAGRLLFRFLSRPPSLSARRTRYDVVVIHEANIE